MSLNEPRVTWWRAFLSATVSTSIELKNRQRKRLFVVLAFLVGWLVFLVLLRIAWGDIRVHARALKVCFTLIGSAFWVYYMLGLKKDLSVLDQLDWRIAVESMAWTHLTGLTVTGLLFFVSALTGLKLNPGWFLPLGVVRTLWLLGVARRYR
jgi:hypothetical protein